MKNLSNSTHFHLRIRKSFFLNSTLKDSSAVKKYVRFNSVLEIYLNRVELVNFGNKWLSSKKDNAQFKPNTFRNMRENSCI